MLRWAHRTIDLFKLDRQERKLNKEWRRKQAEALEKNGPAMLEDWENNYAAQIYADIRWDRRKVVSDALLREADELLLPRPRFGDQTKWDKEEDFYGQPRDGLVLTAEAMNDLRASIRKERKERRETFEWWIKLFGSLTGLIGALIGLVTIWRHK